MGGQVAPGLVATAPHTAVHAAIARRDGSQVMLLKQAVIKSWLATIEAAIRLGDVEAAGRLTVAYVRRLREIGVAGV
jgi:hypothetical protein